MIRLYSFRHSGTHTEEALGGETWMRDTYSNTWHKLRGGNPPVVLPTNSAGVKFLSLPARSGFTETPAVYGSKDFLPFFRYGETLAMNNALPSTQCSSLGINYANSLNIFGTLSGTNTQVRYARYVELDDNTLDAPLAGGGGEYYSQGGYCSNPAISFVNGKKQYS